jgi:hypothetical protein
MDPVSVLEAVAGGALLFFVPGYTVTRAVFPGWRLRGPLALRRGLETVTLSFVLSVVLTVVVGYGLLASTPGGFSATWSQPVLEAALAGIALVAFVAGVFEGAYARTPSSLPAARPEPGGEGAWELTRRLDRLLREERRIVRQLDRGPEGTTTVEGLRQRLAEIRGEEETLRRNREAEYDL